ncbi:MAG: hypothetical protein R2857_12075 [Vampirovibrionales bacterium]
MASMGAVAMAIRLRTIIMTGVKAGFANIKGLGHGGFCSAVTALGLAAAIWLLPLKMWTSMSYYPVHERLTTIKHFEVAITVVGAGFLGCELNRLGCFSRGRRLDGIRLDGRRMRWVGFLRLRLLREPGPGAKL